MSCRGQSADGEIDLYCRNGAISLYRVTADSISLSSEYGSISADTVTVDFFESHSEYNGIRLDNVTVNEGSYLRGGTGLGGISMKGTYLKGRTIVESRGCICGEALKFEGYTSLHTENHIIQLENAVFENMTVSNRNADISISTPDSPTDYTISAEADGGICNVKSGGDGPYALNVRTVGGDIELAFDCENINT